jgi:hypothetical protein
MEKFQTSHDLAQTSSSITVKMEGAERNILTLLTFGPTLLRARRVYLRKRRKRRDGRRQTRTKEEKERGEQRDLRELIRRPRPPTFYSNFDWLRMYVVHNHDHTVGGQTRANEIRYGKWMHHHHNITSKESMEHGMNDDRNWKCCASTVFSVPPYD